MREQDKAPVRLAYERRNRDLDPQLVWRGKDEQDWSDLVVQAPPLFIQEKVHPKVIIDNLPRETRARADAVEPAPDLVADFNGLSGTANATDFYQHDQHWSNRMIVGRLAVRDGEPRRTRGASRQGAVHLPRPRPTASSSTPTSSGAPRLAT
jgi:adenine-specific DNA-methyltransferase